MLFGNTFFETRAYCGLHRIFTNETGYFYRFGFWLSHWSAVILIGWAIQCHMVRATTCPGRYGNEHLCICLENIFRCTPMPYASQPFPFIRLVCSTINLALSGLRTRLVRITQMSSHSDRCSFLCPCLHLPWSPVSLRWLVPKVLQWTV